jgi:hypothetical protein
MLKCPKCTRNLLIRNKRYDWPGLSMFCEACGWQSKDISDLVRASPEYIDAEIAARSRSTGWYGPDGEKCLVAGGFIIWQGVCMRFSQALLCGFVEVAE